VNKDKKEGRVLRKGTRPLRSGLEL
jgi:hypothetical protein